MEYFTHYWARSTVEDHDWHHGNLLDHIAGNQFLARGVRDGDTIFVVSYHNGQMQLIGRICVDRIVSQRTAERVMGRGNLWEANEHIIAATPISRAWFDLIVPREVLNKIRFVVNNKSVPPKVVSPNQLDTQTLRGVRRLSNRSGTLLDILIEEREKEPA